MEPSGIKFSEAQQAIGEEVWMGEEAGTVQKVNEVYFFFFYKISLLKKKERKKKLEMARLVENVLGYKLVRR